MTVALRSQVSGLRFKRETTHGEFLGTTSTVSQREWHSLTRAKPDTTWQKHVGLQAEICIPRIGPEKGLPSISGIVKPCVTWLQQFSGFRNRNVLISLIRLWTKVQFVRLGIFPFLSLSKKCANPEENTCHCFVFFAYLKSACLKTSP